MTQLYKQCGNSIVVNVIEEVLKALFKVMPELFYDIKIIDLFAGIGAFEKAFKRVIYEANAGYIVPDIVKKDEEEILGHCPICNKSMTEDNKYVFIPLYYQGFISNICEDCVSDTQGYTVCNGCVENDDDYNEGNYDYDEDSDDCSEDSYGCFIPETELLQMGEIDSHTGRYLRICKGNALYYADTCEICGRLYYKDHFELSRRRRIYCCRNCADKN